MHGKRENLAAAFKNLRCSVSLMHIQIHHQGALNHTLINQNLRRQCQIIKQTKAFTAVRISMVRAAGDIECYTVFHCIPSALQRAAHDHHFAINQCIRMGENPCAVPLVCSAQVL